jgi:hypothetical protein
MDARISLSDVFSAPRLNDLIEQIVDAQLAEFDPRELAALVESIEDSSSNGRVRKP